MNAQKEQELLEALHVAVSKINPYQALISVVRPLCVR